MLKSALIGLLLLSTTLNADECKPSDYYYNLIGWQVELAVKICKKYDGIEELSVGRVDSFVKCNNYENAFKLSFQTEIKQDIK